MSELILLYFIPYAEKNERIFDSSYLILLLALFFCCFMMIRFVTPRQRCDHLFLSDFSANKTHDRNQRQTSLFRFSTSKFEVPPSNRFIHQDARWHLEPTSTTGRKPPIGLAGASPDNNPRGVFWGFLFFSPPAHVTLISNPAAAVLHSDLMWNLKVLT